VRALIRLLLVDPVALFTAGAIMVLALAIIGFIRSERRARAMAELSADTDMAASQRWRLLLVGLAGVVVLAGAVWWTLVRVHTEPHRVVIAIGVETEDGAAQWWDDPGALALARQLGDQLELLGLETVGFEPKVAEALREAGGDLESLTRAARRLEARWIIHGHLRVDKIIELELASFSDYIMSVELELVDSETGESFAVPGTPLRAFLWGEGTSEAVALNAAYLVDRVTMPLVATFGEREPLLAYAGDRTAMTTHEATLAAALDGLFSRAHSYAHGLAQRERERAMALAAEPPNHAKIPSTRISDILAEEYFVGTAFDGRLILLTEPKHISVAPSRRGYLVTSEGEALVLAAADGGDRALLFEHYNFYSAPGVSADGRVVWTTVANHGAGKTLATLEVETGEFRPLLSHPTHYFTNPIPAPDGARALVYSRSGRYAESSIELLERDGSSRKQIIGPGEYAGVPAWALDGRSIYVPLGDWQRIVQIDLASGQRRHVLGQDPEAPADLVRSELGAPASDPTPDPRHGGSVSSPAAVTFDPATTSRFSALSVGHDGSYLWVTEQSLDGRHWLARFDLAAAPEAAYRRLAQIENRHISASPSGPLVAFEAPSFTAPNDPEHEDQEILVFGPEMGQLRALTLNEVDDELGGWSRDGRSVFTIQRSRDPGSERNPVVRIYRHDL
jgi:hypothetical protein